jgi:hypothetical protein
MDPGVAFHLEIAGVVALALLIVAVVVWASGGAWQGAGDVEAGTTGRATVHAVDVESALGDITLMTYEQAVTGKVKEEERCAMCLSEYGEDGELVRPCGWCRRAGTSSTRGATWTGGSGRAGRARSTAAGSGRSRCRGCHGRNARRCHCDRHPTSVRVFVAMSDC